MKLSDVDLNDLDAFERGCPHDMFETLRREDPVHWHEEPGGPAVDLVPPPETPDGGSRRPPDLQCGD